jgi:hypothetical protein
VFHEHFLIAKEQTMRVFCIFAVLALLVGAPVWAQTTDTVEGASEVSGQVTPADIVQPEPQAPPEPKLLLVQPKEVAVATPEEQLPQATCNDKSTEEVGAAITFDRERAGVTERFTEILAITLMDSCDPAVTAMITTELAQRLDKGDRKRVLAVYQANLHNGTRALKLLPVLGNYSDAQASLWKAFYHSNDLISRAGADALLRLHRTLDEDEVALVAVKATIPAIAEVANTIDKAYAQEDNVLLRVMLKHQNQDVRATAAQVIWNHNKAHDAIFLLEAYKAGNTQQRANFLVALTSAMTPSRISIFEYALSDPEPLIANFAKKKILEIDPRRALYMRK